MCPNVHKHNNLGERKRKSVSVRFLPQPFLQSSQHQITCSLFNTRTFDRLCGKRDPVIVPITRNTRKINHLPLTLLLRNELWVNILPFYPKLVVWVWKRWTLCLYYHTRNHTKRIMGTRHCYRAHYFHQVWVLQLSALEFVWFTVT